MFKFFTRFSLSTTVPSLATFPCRKMHSERKTSCHMVRTNFQCQIWSYFFNKTSCPMLHFFIFSGCFCTYSNPSSFEYIRDSLEKTLLSNLEQEDRLPFQGLPLVIVFAAEPGLSEKDLQTLREEGSSLAESLQSPFIDVSQVWSPSSFGIEMPRFNK